MTFILYYYNKYSRIVIKLLIALGYTIEVVIGSGNIICIAESDFTNKYEFKNLI
jgi:hypothetical protein